MTEETVEFSYSYDKIHWGLRNEYIYHWNLNDPYVHFYCAGKRDSMSSLVISEDAFEPLLKLNSNKWSSIICNDASEKPKSNDIIYYCVRAVINGVKDVHEGVVPRDENNILVNSVLIKNIYFAKDNLEYVVLYHSFN